MNYEQKTGAFIGGMGVLGAALMLAFSYDWQGAIDDLTGQESRLRARAESYAKTLENLPELPAGDLQDLDDAEFAMYREHVDQILRHLEPSEARGAMAMQLLVRFGGLKSRAEIQQVHVSGNRGEVWYTQVVHRGPLAGAYARQHTRWRKVEGEWYRVVE